MSLNDQEKALIQAAMGLFFQRKTGGGLMLKLRQAIMRDMDSGHRSEPNGHIELDRVEAFEKAMRSYREHLLSNMLYDDLVTHVK